MRTTIDSAGRVVIPKAVREALHLKAQSDLVGFVIYGGRVALTRIDPVPSSDPFSDKEWKQIERLAAQPPVAVCENAEDSLRYLKRHLDSNL